MTWFRLSDQPRAVKEGISLDMSIVSFSVDEQSRDETCIAYHKGSTNRRELDGYGVRV